MPAGPDSRDGGSQSPRKASTIRDVATLAGVSKSTASRALLGQPGVSPENLEKVQQAIRQLDFVPNRIARSLSAPSPAMLGLFLRNSDSPFYGHLAKAFDGEADRRGYEVLSVASGDQTDDANYQSLMVLVGLRTAGIVVATPVVDPLTIRRVAARVPLVLVGQIGQPDNPEVPFVAPDPKDGLVLVDQVLAHGHTSVALTAVPPEQSPTQWVRIEEMQRHLATRGVRHRVVTVQPDTDLSDLVAGLVRDRVTAVLCNNDFVALDVLAAAARLGIAIPGELSVAGFDGLPPFDHEAVGLTTYRVPAAAMAAAAADLVDRLVRGETVDAGGSLLPGELVVGRTTGPAPTS
ncbi:LacI family DNA-binding transcriptional regulator [Microlunatus sp. GCM10028923]|uniref:LacI family DNA-binding transcriptional regulator n=1 Tax=Microlunatus sp. GCM10028923 TaxID=3273400 RepID=UPI003616ADB4